MWSGEEEEEGREKVGGRGTYIPKFGKEGTTVPYRACAPPSHSSASERPCVPVMRMGKRNSTVRKPVARTSMSCSLTSPFSNSIPVSVTLLMLPVSSVVFSCPIAG